MSISVVLAFLGGCVVCAVCIWFVRYVQTSYQDFFQDLKTKIRMYRVKNNDDMTDQQVRDLISGRCLVCRIPFVNRFVYVRVEAIRRYEVLRKGARVYEGIENLPLPK